jgi:hypothetical protein
MKNIFSALGLLALVGCGISHKTTDVINAKEVERIEHVLASDDMRGRKTFSPEIDKAADFISAEFKSIGLSTYNGASSYRQSFVMVRPKFVSASATMDGSHRSPAEYHGGYLHGRPESFRKFGL